MSFFLFNHLSSRGFTTTGRRDIYDPNRGSTQSLPGLSSSCISIGREGRSDPPFLIYLVRSSSSSSSSSLFSPLVVTKVGKLIDSKSMVQIRSVVGVQARGEKCTRNFSPWRIIWIREARSVPRARCTGAALQVLQVPGNGGTSQPRGWPR